MIKAIHEYENLVICPYCNYKHEDMCDYGFKNWNDGEEIEFTCDSCGKIFDVELYVSQKFSSYPKGQPGEKEND